MGRRLAPCALALALVACVAETTAIGDDRSRAACAEAMVIEAPESGCSPVVRIEARASFGCAVREDDGAVLGEETGTWVRLRRSPDRAAVVRVRDLDVGPGEASSGVVLAGGGAACTCEVGLFQGLGVGATRLERPLVYVDQELLLEATGHRYEIEVCAVDEDPYPRCNRALADAGVMCSGLPYVQFGAVCACLPPCTSSSQCPTAATGGATPECLGTGCELRCSASAPCPEGQECIADYHGGTCMWPG